MAYTPAQGRATRRYNEKSYDRINLLVRRGRRDELHAYASGRGESLNGFILRAIEGQIARDRDAGPEKDEK